MILLILFADQVLIIEESDFEAVMDINRRSFVALTRFAPDQKVLFTFDLLGLLRTALFFGLDPFDLVIEAFFILEHGLVDTLHAGRSVTHLLVGVVLEGLFAREGLQGAATALVSDGERQLLVLDLFHVARLGLGRLLSFLQRAHLLNIRLLLQTQVVQHASLR